MNWNYVFPLPLPGEVDARNCLNRDERLRGLIVPRSPYLVAQWNIQRNHRFLGFSVEMRADYAPKGSYQCVAQWAMDLSEFRKMYPDAHFQTDSVGGYMGLQVSQRGPQSILSLWDVLYHDSYGQERTLRAKLVYPEERATDNFGNEGTGAHRIVPFAWEPGRWYRLTVHCVKCPENGHTLIEQLICDVKTGIQTRLACYDTGMPETYMLAPFFSFLENYLTDYAADIRTMEMRDCYVKEAESLRWLPVKMGRLYSSVGAPKYRGSYNFGQEEERIWMIADGLGNGCRRVGRPGGDEFRL